MKRILEPKSGAQGYGMWAESQTESHQTPPPSRLRSLEQVTSAI